MNSPATELLLRVVGDRLGGRRCVRCQATLTGARLELLESNPDAIAIRALCECGATLDLRVEPEADGGTAQVVR